MKKKINLPSQRFQPVYSCSYVLRIWRESASQRAGWRITLEDPLTNERFGFASLDQLHTFLMRQMDKE